jgi:septal ring factor EnvC (AmiA/AmiB activator)
MVPLGDIVSKEERDRRLSRFHKEGFVNKSQRLINIIEQSEKEPNRDSLKKKIDDLHGKLVKMEGDTKTSAQDLQDTRKELAELSAQYNRMIG